MLHMLGSQNLYGRNNAPFQVACTVKEERKEGRKVLSCVHGAAGRKREGGRKEGRKEGSKERRKEERTEASEGVCI